MTVFVCSTSCTRGWSRGEGSPGSGWASTGVGLTLEPDVMTLPMFVVRVAAGVATKQKVHLRVLVVRGDSVVGSVTRVSTGRAG